MGHGRFHELQVFGKTWAQQFRVRMHHAARVRLSLVLFGTSLIGCQTDSALSGLGGKKKGSRGSNESALNTQDGEKDTENKSANEPQMVSGAFLTCARITSKEDPNLEQEQGDGIGCRVSTAEKKKLKDLPPTVKVRWSSGPDESTQLAHRVAPQDSLWHYFIYFSAGLKVTGKLEVSFGSLSGNGGATSSLSFPMEKIQETTIQAKGETPDVVINKASSAGGASEVSDAKNPPSDTPPVWTMRSKHYWPLGSAASKIASDLLTSMFCERGRVKEKIETGLGARFAYGDDTVKSLTEDISITPDNFPRPACFGMLNKAGGGRGPGRNARVQEGDGCYFMHDNKHLLIYPTEGLADSVRQQLFAKLQEESISRMPCEGS